jgi:hypothetical protein
VKVLFASYASRAGFRGVELEPSLTPITTEEMKLKSANTQDGARGDIAVIDFFQEDQVALFDVRIVHAQAVSYANKPIPNVLQQIANTKKREYTERVNRLDGAVFVPLVFASNGAQGRETSMALKVLASALAVKHNTPYSRMMGLVRCDFSFALLKSAISCIVGYRGGFKLSQLGNSLDYSTDLYYHETKLRY